MTKWNNCFIYVYLAIYIQIYHLSLWYLRALHREMQDYAARELAHKLSHPIEPLVIQLVTLPEADFRKLVFHGQL